jgi:hypothetical protein
MSFDRSQVAELLALCHRRCCICHRFCGVKMETDHITPKSEGGDDTIDNAITVCFECHAEIHSYNIKHPRGRKFTSEELKMHKKNWLNVCENRPDVLVVSYERSDVGPLQSLVDELEFNKINSMTQDIREMGCLFKDDQFNKAIQMGSVSILDDQIKIKLIKAYVAMGNYNSSMIGVLNQPFGSNPWAKDINHAQKLLMNALPIIEECLNVMSGFLSND